jgi:putative selenium metabolism hydrolase
VVLEEGSLRPNWVVLAESSNLQIMRGHRGRVMLKIAVHGQGSHASNPELGENAITAAARLIFGIEMLPADLADDPFLGAGTIAVTHIESRSAGLNAIPSRCTLYVDRRLTLGESATRARAEIESVIGREGLNAEVEIVEHVATSYTGYQYHVREAFNAWALEPDRPLIQDLGRVAQEVLGDAPAVDRWAFSTDGVYTMGELGIPTVGFGPGNPAHAHTVHEQVPLDDVARAAQVYARLATTLLSG